ncbi:MAG: BamA/TamA family outer membrane protein [Saprospiraceae bacterium]|nr:BamA/TamA family outer membrane protein [Saprospiraceae bacterium]
MAKLKETPVIFVNQGDIKLELNAEYRFKILLLLDGAFLWMPATSGHWDDPNRPGAVISSKFLDQMAIGAGYGIRFNFNFFIIRFDCGYKIRSPFEDPYKKSQWYSFKEIRQQGLGNVQVAVNYPF